MAAVKPENGPLYAGLKPEQGLYHPANEHDACGIGMICSIRNERSRGAQPSRAQPTSCEPQNAKPS